MPRRKKGEPRPRRPRGEGTVFERVRDGRKYYVAAISTTDVFGKRTRREVWATSEPLALAKLARLKAKAVTGTLPSSDRTTFAGFLEHWIANVAPAKVQPSTLLRYGALVRKWLIDAVGELRLAALEPTDAARIHRRLRAAGASASTIAKAHIVMRSALADAERTTPGFRSPFAHETAPRYEPAEIEPYSVDEIRAFLEAARGTTFEHLFVTALFTQMREGELLALRWRNVHLDEAFIIVDRGLQDQGTGTRSKTGKSERTTHGVAGPKTRAGRRRIDLPRIVVEALRAQREALKRRRLGESALVFPSTEGKVVSRQNLLPRHLYPIMAKAGLRRITFHALRHSGNTLLAERIPLMVLSKRMGHATIQPTSNTYGHLSPTMQADAVAFIDDLFPVPEKHAG